MTSTVVGLRELRDCYYHSGRFRRERLFVATDSNGDKAIVYPVYSPGGSPIYVVVGEA